jgi:hypothetical protein
MENGKWKMEESNKYDKTYELSLAAYPLRLTVESE